MGLGRTPRVRAVQARQDQPQLLHQRLNALIAQTYAATGKTSGLSAEDLNKPDVISFGTSVESAVVHYGDTTLTFLNNLYQADQRSSALSYVSAVAVEEKSVIDYNQGNPDGILDPGEQPRPPKVPLVAIYPKEGTLFSDSPYFVLDAPWVTPEAEGRGQGLRDLHQAAGEPAEGPEFQLPPRQPRGADRRSDHRGERRRSQPAADAARGASSPRAHHTARQVGSATQEGQVTLVLDVSGSMGDPADPKNPDAGTKLDLAKQAIREAVGSSAPTTTSPS